MSKVADCEVFSVDELTEALAETTGTPVEDIDKGAEEMYFVFPEEGTVVNE